MSPSPLPYPSLSPSPAGPSPRDSAGALRPLILAHRETTEADRRLAAPIVAALADHRLGRLGLNECPVAADEPPSATLEAIETLAAAEASVAWVVWNSHLTCAWARYLQDGPRRDVFDPAVNLCANSLRPDGIARPVDGGFVVSGRWSLVSGSEVCDRFALRCLIQTDPDAPPVPGPTTPARVFFVPRSGIEIVDTWKVMGLRGTGSHDVVVTEQFVPAGRTFDFGDPVRAHGRRDRLPIGCVNAAGYGAIALGLARSAVQELVDVGRARVTASKAPDLRDREPIQHAVATGRYRLESARAQLHRCVDALWAATERPATPESVRELVCDTWVAAHHAVAGAKRSIATVHEVAGTLALYESSRIERCLRDVFAVSQHGTVQPHWVREAGRVRLGLEATMPMMFR